MACSLSLDLGGFLAERDFAHNGLTCELLLGAHVQANLSHLGGPLYFCGLSLLLSHFEFQSSCFGLPSKEYDLRLDRVTFCRWSVFKAKLFFLSNFGLHGCECHGGRPLCRLKRELRLDKHIFLNAGRSRLSLELRLLVLGLSVEELLGLDPLLNLDEPGGFLGGTVLCLEIHLLQLRLFKRQLSGTTRL